MGPTDGWVRVDRVRLVTGEGLFSMNLVIRSSLIVASLLLPSSVGAECITPGRWSLDQPSVELVFSGNVVAVNQVADAGVRVTFNVDRVWKGSVPKRFDVYVWQLDSEMPRFEFAKSYVVFTTT